MFNSILRFLHSLVDVASEEMETELITDPGKLSKEF